jgi:cytochrome c oxidase subunit 3
MGSYKISLFHYTLINLFSILFLILVFAFCWWDVIIAEDLTRQIFIKYTKVDKENKFKTFNLYLETKVFSLFKRLISTTPLNLELNKDLILNSNGNTLKPLNVPYIVDVKHSFINSNFYKDKNKFSITIIPKYYTLVVQQMLRNGIILFIVSEFMLFFSFFFAYGAVSIAPSHQIYCWPPIEFPILSPWGIPLLNTCILLWSGIVVTTAHRILLHNPNIWNRVERQNNQGYLKTILDSAGQRLRNAFFLGFLFISLQVFEYFNAPFSINDSVYGSVFYILTGFHGMHVFIGAIFLLVVSIRCLKYHYDEYNQFVGLEGGLWYWHFVDVVWLLLYLLLYIWPYMQEGYFWQV